LTVQVFACARINRWPTNFPQLGQQPASARGGSVGGVKSIFTGGCGCCA
jgi:hypothetical protein